MDTGSEAGMTGFLGLFNCFGGPILVNNLLPLYPKRLAKFIPDSSGPTSRNPFNQHPRSGGTTEYRRDSYHLKCDVLYLQLL